ncbi:TetR family transcriptional regulator [Herbaspirillum rubrisubalbicans]|uniref:TetR family transcriptional regulator n=1 Tax=Herbaspirillum rubrisubalbicans TaxID=80842 RepID=A0AAD0U6X3_9BURK|nr:TetR family transcriptional regulator [Herbaspirillum rubrisubalbicans]ALU88386.1 TetR family transcriptional regulator protein [Herbaspirillum rubrisubalbicans M1]AYR23471.1 TetR family transcriptional regulator [Herbaspirillum rubrisubalbicans]
MSPRADKTRAILLDAALAAFARRGVRATTLEHVAASADFTRGAVYWHFPDKTALVKAVFEELVWPFDLGPDLAVYRQSEQPMLLLREVLWLKMLDCLRDVRQRRRMEVVLRYRGTPELPEELAARLDTLSLQALDHLTAVLNIAYERGELRRGLTPIDVARCLVAACMGVIAEHMEDPQARLEHSFHLAPLLVLQGASAMGGEEA